MKKLLLLLLLMSPLSWAESLEKVTIDFDVAEFYLVDINDYGKKAIPAIDAYVYNDRLYLALTPLFEGLRFNYTFINNQLTVIYGQDEAVLSLDDSLSLDGDWFFDGGYYFISAEVLERLFSTQISLNTNSLVADFSGHTGDFPYKLINRQNQQRSANKYLVRKDKGGVQNRANSVITVPDQYRLATVPNGFMSLDYRKSQFIDEHRLILQSTSDLLYHSAELTLTSDSDVTDSRMYFSRYPSAPGEKILGFLDRYSFGDVWVRSSSLSNSSDKGLGGYFTTSSKGESATENMKTSFAKSARPGWEYDVFHNDVFLYNGVVPDDGLIEFEELEVFYGANEFKIILYGPYGEQEELYEQLDVRGSGLAPGSSSFSLTLIEEDQSLLSLNPSEFNLDVIGANVGFGVTNYWQVGVGAGVRNLSDSETKQSSYSISNRFNLPGVYIDNTTNFTNKSFNQRTSLGTSFIKNDSLVLRYNSQWAKAEDEFQETNSDLQLNYNIRGSFYSNNFAFDVQKNEFETTELFRHSANFFFRNFNLGNTLTYRKDSDTEILTGSFGMSTRISGDIRLTANVPYEVDDSIKFDPNLISVNLNYYKRFDSATHSLNLSTRSILEDQYWTAGYSLAINQPTHQFTFRAQYDSNDSWSLAAGLVLNFGYDYFNNRVIFSNTSIRQSGTFDVRAYLDRRLNGVRDVLDYDLEGVTFSGSPNWEGITTNKQGQARLFGGLAGASGLSASWTAASATINNDYLIYSHPGGAQNINLPFYLTTEVEFFTLLEGDQLTALSGVPIIAENMSTGDVYSIDSSYDGYVTFTDLLPGEYVFKVEDSFLQKRELSMSSLGIRVSIPLKGGFVILPDMSLIRNDGEEVNGKEFIDVELTEQNYEPLVPEEDKDIIHLPPKGGFKAPHSLDNLHQAEFNRIRAKVTKEERKSLREKFEKARETAIHVGAGSKVSRKFVALETDNNSEYQLYIGSYETYGEAERAALFMHQNPQVKQGLDSSGTKVYRFFHSIFNTEQEAIEFARAEYPMESYRTYKVAKKAKVVDGWVIQFAATQDLSRADELLTMYANIEDLHTAKKEVNGQMWYCLISRVYINKEAAQRYLDSSNVDGFLARSSRYIEALKVNK